MTDWKPAEIPPWDGKTEVSVICPFANEGQNVVFTTQALIEELNGFCRFEIILIDNQSDWYINCSIKNERLMLHQNKEQPYKIRSRAFFQAPPGSKSEGSIISTHFFRKGIVRYLQFDEKQSHWLAKNHGIFHSRGKYLFFVDAHCIMNRDGLRAMIQFLRDNPDEKIGGAHAYINYMLDSRALEYRPQKNKFFGYQFVSAQREEYWVDAQGKEVDVSEEVRLVTRAAMQPPNPKAGESWTSKYGSDPVVAPFLLPNERGVAVDPAWPQRCLREKTKPYKVCVASTCGMIVPRTVFQELGPWNAEFGSYCGGEGYHNFKTATCGYHQWIVPAAKCWHWAEQRGYSWRHDDYVRNEQIAAYVNGGDEALDFCVKGRGSGAVVQALAADVKEKCGPEREFVKSRQVETLEDYFNRWVSSPGIWR